RSPATFADAVGSTAPLACTRLGNAAARRFRRRCSAFKRCHVRGKAEGLGILHCDEQNPCPQSTTRRKIRIETRRSHAVSVFEYRPLGGLRTEASVRHRERTNIRTHHGSRDECADRRRGGERVLDGYVTVYA